MDTKRCCCAGWLGGTRLLSFGKFWLPSFFSSLSLFHSEFVFFSISVLCWDRSSSSSSSPDVAESLHSHCCWWWCRRRRCCLGNTSSSSFLGKWPQRPRCRNQCMTSSRRVQTGCCNRKEDVMGVRYRCYMRDLCLRSLHDKRPPVGKKLFQLTCLVHAW